MLERASLPIGSKGYRALGLMANPFRGSAWQPNDETFAELLSHAAAVQLMTALEHSLDSGKSEPVWASGEATVPDYYRRLAVSETIYATTDNDELGLLVANVPFPLLSLGRIRSALQVVGERLSGVTFGRTLGLYCAAALADFDPSLPEASALTPEQVADIRARFEGDPERTAAAVFGECVAERDENADVSAMMREVTMRESMQSRDLEQAEEGEETDETTETLLEPPSETHTSAHVEDRDEETKLTEAAREYLIAHIRVHLSPVIARAVTAYVDSGTHRVGQELKITKAPRKTLAALAGFASHRYRGVVVLYDDFEQWARVPDEVKASVAAALTELRWALKPMGILAFVTVEDMVPELQEQFGSARPVEWKMLDVWQTLTSPEPLDEAAMRTLLQQNALPGGPDPMIVEQVLDVLKESEGDLERFVLLAGAAIDAEAEARV